MRRVIMAAVSTVAALILLLSFKTHSATSLATPSVAVATAVPSTGSTTSATPSAAAPSASTSVPASTAATKTTAPTTAAAPTTTTATGTKAVAGDAIDTRYGAVQVQITVTNGKLTAVQAVDYPQQERRDQEINAYAIPVLNKEALAAGSAKIDNVSGATYTSEGYASSLQSALDKAGL